MSINRMSGVLGLAEKTPLRFASLEDVLSDDVSFVPMTWLGVFWFLRMEIMGSM